MLQSVSGQDTLVDNSIEGSVLRLNKESIYNDTEVINTLMHEDYKYVKGQENVVIDLAKLFVNSGEGTGKNCQTVMYKLVSAQMIGSVDANDNLIDTA